MTHPETFEPITYDDIERVGFIVKVKGTDQLYQFALSREDDAYFRGMAKTMRLGIALLPIPIRTQIVFNPDFEADKCEHGNLYSGMEEYFSSKYAADDAEFMAYIETIRASFYRKSQEGNP